ncbi:5006_t:CDS:2, partial [Entrophospora sp. SA101]
QSSEVANILETDLQISSTVEETSDGTSEETSEEDPSLRGKASRITRAQRRVDNIIQELGMPVEGVMNDVNEEEHDQTEATESAGVLMARLYRKACRAEMHASNATQKEILCWYRYGEKHENRVNEILSSNRITEKTVRSRVYKEVLEHLPDITLANLRQKTQKARIVYKLFKGVGVDKIKLISYSANSISELSVSQIDTIVNQFSIPSRTQM